MLVSPSPPHTVPRAATKVELTVTAVLWIAFAGGLTLIAAICVYTIWRGPTRAWLFWKRNRDDKGDQVEDVRSQGAPAFKRSGSGTDGSNSEMTIKDKDVEGGEYIALPRLGSPFAVPGSTQSPVSSPTTPRSPHRLVKSPRPLPSAQTPSMSPGSASSSPLSPFSPRGSAWKSSPKGVEMGKAMISAPLFVPKPTSLPESLGSADVLAAGSAGTGKHVRSKTVSTVSSFGHDPRGTVVSSSDPPLPQQQEFISRSPTSTAISPPASTTFVSPASTMMPQQYHTPMYSAVAAPVETQPTPLNQRSMMTRPSLVSLPPFDAEHGRPVYVSPVQKQPIIHNPPRRSSHMATMSTGSRLSTYSAYSRKSGMTNEHVSFVPPHIDQQVPPQSGQQYPAQWSGPSLSHVNPARASMVRDAPQRPSIEIPSTSRRSAVMSARYRQSPLSAVYTSPEIQQIVQDIQAQGLSLEQQLGDPGSASVGHAI